MLRFHWPRLSTTHHVLSAHTHNLPLYVGKGRQLQDLISLLDADAMRARDMCSTEF
jgi:hypothetical protein